MRTSAASATSATSVASVSGPMVQRSCTTTSEAAGEASAAEAPAIVHDVLRSPGQRLDPATREFLQPRFGFDLSRVRVHDDDRAARSASSVGARAYTVGSDVVFGAGQYRPQAAGGQHLLAHELAHVGQQQGPGAPTVLRRATEGPPLEVRDEEEAPITDEDSDASLEEDDAADGDMPTTREALEEAPESPSEGEEEPAIDLDQAGESAEMQAGGKQKPPKKKAADRKITQIDVDLTGQSLVLNWSDGTKSGPIQISSGKGLPNTTDDPCKNPSVNGSNCTPPGTFTIGFRGGADYKNNHGDKMAWYAEFLSARDIGIHDSQRVTGKPASHGCVRIDLGSAKLINANVIPNQTKVVVSGKAPTKPWKKKVKTKAKAKPKAKGKGK